MSANGCTGIPEHFKNLRYYSYSNHIRQRFGYRLKKVTIDAGFTCPNRDGTAAYGGCTYCNNDGFSPASAAFRNGRSVVPVVPVYDQIEKGINRLPPDLRTGRFIGYFQAFSNTYAPVETLRVLYEEALSHPKVAGLAIGTRPDCVDADKLDYIRTLADRSFVTVEYGCESIYDKTLAWINRAHDYRSFLDAVEQTASRGIDICAHVILGFPTETREEMLSMADAMSALPITSIKIHNLHVVRHTVLADMYRKNPFRLLEYEVYAELVCDFLERLSPAIAVQRLFGDAQNGLMIAPVWKINPRNIAADINQRLEKRGSRQGLKTAAMTLAQEAPP